MRDRCQVSFLRRQPRSPSPEKENERQAFRLALVSMMAPSAGLEPATWRLTAACSTAELRRNSENARAPQSATARTPPNSAGIPRP